MLVQFSPVDLLKGIKEKVEQRTGLSCYDFVEESTQGPFYFMQFLKKHSRNNKTMYIDKYQVAMHVISGKSYGHVEVLELCTRLEEALSEEIKLPSWVTLLSQTSEGISHLRDEETKEKHAVIIFNFEISYGYKRLGGN